MQQNYILRYDPRPTIFQKGNCFHLLKALSFLEDRDEGRLHDVLEEVRCAQNDDGGWPWLGRWDSDERAPSSVTDTAGFLSALMDAGVDTHSEEVERASVYLLDCQRDDGGWSENPQLRNTMSESWTWFSVDHSVTWITALVITALVRAGHASHAPRMLRAVEFLKTLQNEEGGWPSHAGSEQPERTDMWTMEDIVSALLIAGEERASPIIKRAENAILAHRDRWKEPVENPLGVFLALGYAREHRYVAECIRHLLETQKEDGGWGYYNDWPSHPDQTVRWLRVLLKYGVKVS